MAEPSLPVEEHVADLCEEIVDMAVVKHYDRVADETFEECLLCGKWEEHADICPIPAIEKWMKAATNK